MSEIVVFGSANFDFSFSAEEFPKPGEVVMGRFRFTPGGKGLNQAVAAHRLNSDVRLVAPIGNDLFGEMIARFIQEERLPANLITINDICTGIDATLINKTGENSIVVDLGANLALRSDPKFLHELDGARVLVTQLELECEVIEPLLAAAKRENILSIHTAGPDPRKIPPHLLHYIDVLIVNEFEFVSLLEHLGIVFPNEFPNHALIDSSSCAIAALARRIGVSTVVVTLGKRGAVISYGENQSVEICAKQGIEVVDTTGAGDAFAGAFAVGMLRFSNDIVQSAQFASEVAAIAVSRRGAALAMPILSDLPREFAQLEPLRRIA